MQNTSTNTNYRNSQYLIRANVTGNLGITSAMRYKAIYGEDIDRYQVLRVLHRENTFRFWWYLIGLIATVVNLCLYPSSWLACIEVVVLMLNIDFLCRGKVIGIYLGILDCLIYIAICSMTGLWGEVIKMCAINIPLNVWAIISWTKNIKEQTKNGTKTKSSTIEIRKLSTKGYLVSALVFVVACVGGYFLLRALGTTSLILSTIAFAFGLICKVLATLRYKESYYFVIIKDLIAIALWISVLVTSGPASAIGPMILVLISLSDGIYGLIFWKQMYRQNTVNGGRILAKRKVNIKRIIKLRRMYKNLYWNKEVDISKNS